MFLPAFFLWFITFACTLAACAFTPQKIIHSALVIVGGYLLAVSLLYMLPEVFHHQKNIESIAIFVLCGFLFQHFLEHFSTGIEHGHMEHPSKKQHALTPYVITLSLMAHSLLEGLAIHANGLSRWDAVGYLFYCSVLLHKIPVAFAFVFTLRPYTKTKGHLVFLSFLFACCSPLGMALIHFTNSFPGPEAFLMLRAFVAGCFLCIAATIFFESSPGHTYNWKKVFMSSLGVLLGALSGQLFH